MRKLRKNVTMPLSEDGSEIGSKIYGPDYPDPMPSWVRERLKDFDVWDEPVNEDDDEEKPVYAMNKKELVAYAKEIGVDSSGTMDDIKERIEAKEG